MFLDSFPLYEPESRPTRPPREPALETAKSRSAWPFVVTGNSLGFGVPQGSKPADAAALPAASFSPSSSFVT